MKNCGANRIKRILRGVVLILFLFVFFVIASGLDFIVNRVLYNFGLKFSFGWAIPYWLLYDGLFLIFGVSVSFAYWLGSNRNHKNVKFTFYLFFSVVLLIFGGLVDVIFFIFWGGGLPDFSVVWWWTPWYALLGFRNSLLQLLLLSAVTLIVVLMWIQAFKNKF